MEYDFHDLKKMTVAQKRAYDKKRKEAHARNVACHRSNEQVVMVR